MVNVIDVALGGPSVQGEQPEQRAQRERLMALAAQVAVESDPEKFHALILELAKVLNEAVIPMRGNGKTWPQPRAK